MASERQQRANRKNAEKSTGPRSSAGKAVSRQNALSHGLLAQEVVIEGEDRDDYLDLQFALRDQLEPVGPLEEQLADQAVAAFWRLRRLCKVETGVFAFQRLTVEKERAKQARETLRYKSNFDLDFTSHEAVDQCEALEEEIDKAERALSQPVPTLGAAFIRDATTSNALSKLSRYEASLERSLYRALHELRRLQEVRQSDKSNQLAAPNATIDHATT